MSVFYWGDVVIDWISVEKDMPPVGDLLLGFTSSFTGRAIALARLMPLNSQGGTSLYWQDASTRVVIRAGTVKAWAKINLPLTNVEADRNA